MTENNHYLSIFSYGCSAARWPHTLLSPSKLSLEPRPADQTDLLTFSIFVINTRQMGRIIHCSDLVLRINDSHEQVSMYQLHQIKRQKSASVKTQNIIPGYWKPDRMDPTKHRVPSCKAGLLRHTRRTRLQPESDGHRDDLDLLHHR